jgi:hypothetical protein
MGANIVADEGAISGSESIANGRTDSRSYTATD